MSFYKKGRTATAVGLARALMARRRSYSSAFGRSRRSTGRSVRARYAAARSYVRTTRRKKRMSSGRGITRDIDRRLIYRRRSMPKWKRRRWRKFTKKVLAVSTIGQGTHTFVHKPAADELNLTDSNSQVPQTYALYGNRSTQRKLDHLHMIGNLGNTGDQTSFQGNTVYSTTTIQIRSAIADFTFTNKSTRNSASPNSDDPLADFSPLEVDLYEITMSKKATWLNTGTPAEIANLTDVLNFGTPQLIDNETSYAARTASGTTLQFRGMTPWDFPENLSQFGVKIHKKTKFFLKNGEYFTYQMRDPRNYQINRSRLEDVPGVNYPGMTKFLYVIYKPVPGVETGTSEGSITHRLFVGQTYKYTYKIEGITEDRILAVTA